MQWITDSQDVCLRYLWMCALPASAYAHVDARITTKIYVARLPPDQAEIHIKYDSALYHRWHALRQEKKKKKKIQETTMHVAAIIGFLIDSLNHRYHIYVHVYTRRMHIKQIIN